MIVQLTEDEHGNLIMPLPEDALQQMGWKVGDTLQWKDNENGSFTLSKKITQFVLVETVHSTKVQYVVEVPVGKTSWALDSVELREATQFTTRNLGFHIVSHNVIDASSVVDEFKKEMPHVQHSLTDADILEKVTYF
jgi:hypothetical protein